MTDVRVRCEPLTYSPEGRHSFFADLARRNSDEGAAERLARHQREVAAEEASRPAPEGRELPPGTEFRALSTAAGAGGEFAPPLWLIDRFAGASRAGRPFADLIGSMPLPAGVSSIHIPRMPQGSLASAQTDGNAAPNQDITTADASSSVVTIAAEVDVSLQLQEQSPIGFDAAVYIDATRRYNQSLEAQLVAGTGASGQLLGVLGQSGVPGANLVSGAAVTTLQTLWPLLGQAAAAVGNNRLLPPEVWLLAPRRWFWAASSLDTSNRPIASPHSFPSPSGFPIEGGYPAIGGLLGLPAYADGAIAAGASADTAYCVRPSDMFLWEGLPRFTVAGDTALSGNLQVKIVLHRYAAAVLGRYPQGIGAVQNIPAPTNF